MIKCTFRMVYFILQIIVHHKGKQGKSSRQELEAEITEEHCLLAGFQHYIHPPYLYDLDHLLKSSVI